MPSATKSDLRRAVIKTAFRAHQSHDLRRAPAFHNNNTPIPTPPFHQADHPGCFEARPARRFASACGGSVQVFGALKDGNGAFSERNFEVNYYDTATSCPPPLPLLDDIRGDICVVLNRLHDTNANAALVADRLLGTVPVTDNASAMGQAEPDCMVSLLRQAVRELSCTVDALNIHIGRLGSL